MKKKKKHILNEKGLTLVEVMVAITILLMAAEIISLSVTFAARMNTRSREIFKANEEVGKKILDKDNGLTGTMSMEINGGKISNDADVWMYSEQAGSFAEGFKANAMWADDTVMADLYQISGVEAAEYSKRDEPAGLPKKFPVIDEENSKFQVIHVDDYVQVNEESGTLTFLNGTIEGDLPTFVDLGDIFKLSSSNTCTSTGITVMAIGGVDLQADRISIWMNSEVYYLYGKIECTYTDKYKEKPPIHMYLMPESGHKQPALVFVEAGTSINFYIKSEDGAMVRPDDSRTIEFQESGWYAIPSDGSTGSAEEQARNARDLFQVAATEGGWEQYRLIDGNPNLEAGAVDKAYARLVLAGIIDKEGTE